MRYVMMCSDMSWSSCAIPMPSSRLMRPASKRGRKSAGVQRQYCGTTGRVENCQVAVFASYVSPKGHALIDRELSLPQGWTQDPQRCREAGIPETVEFQTKCELAQRIVQRLLKMGISISWVVADTVYGGNLELRIWLEVHGYAYVLAVPCDEPVAIQTLDGRKWVQVREVEALLLKAEDWQRLSMSQGTKGPRLFDWACVPILHQWHDDGRHWLLIRRCLDDPKQKAYSFVFAPRGTTLEEMVKAIGARWRVEEDFQTTKAMGLDQYEVRSWTGWYRHITLVMLAYAFLTGICARAKAQSSLPLPVPLEETHINSPLCTCANRTLLTPTSPCALVPSQHPHVLSSSHDQEVQAAPLLCTCANRMPLTPTSPCALVPSQHPHVLSSSHDQEVQADEKPLIALTVAEICRLLGRLSSCLLALGISCLLGQIGADTTGGSPVTIIANVVSRQVNCPVVRLPYSSHRPRFQQETSGHIICAP